MSRAIGRLQDRQSALRVFEGSRQVTLLLENRGYLAHRNRHVGVLRSQRSLDNRERSAIVRQRTGQVPLSEQNVADVSDSGGQVRVIRAVDLLADIEGPDYSAAPSGGRFWTRGKRS